MIVVHTYIGREREQRKGELGVKDAQQVKISEKMNLSHNLCPLLYYIHSYIHREGMGAEKGGTGAKDAQQVKISEEMNLSHNLCP